MKYVPLKEWVIQTSVTQIILVVLSIRLLFYPDLYMAMAVFSALFTCAYETYLAFQLRKEDVAQTSIEELQQAVAKINQTLTTINGTQALVAKQAEETKKLISSSHLAQAFVPRNKRPERDA